MQSLGSCGGPAVHLRSQPFRLLLLSQRVGQGRSCRPRCTSREGACVHFTQPLRQPRTLKRGVPLIQAHAAGEYHLHEVWVRLVLNAEGAPLAQQIPRLFDRHIEVMHHHQVRLIISQMQRDVTKHKRRASVLTIVTQQHRESVHITTVDFCKQFTVRRLDECGVGVHDEAAVLRTALHRSLHDEAQLLQHRPLFLLWRHID
ncbi:hypothetical protein DQ04_12271000 [Trypanosoma grayi]|uniref:hypothetical protein n=1 Tax=Trypanosoma grayi TaxID=71804 RepID=UPI0004F4A2CD|nr:hypothetical protein DQ04_12271000 [Trypanosoma grayi]KEG06780.1 hypothetical protein DQ04_12271000 [Trypanosoma grayi]